MKKINVAIEVVIKIVAVIQFYEYIENIILNVLL